MALTAKDYGQLCLASATADCISIAGERNAESLHEVARYHEKLSVYLKRMRETSVDTLDAWMMITWEAKEEPHMDPYHDKDGGILLLKALLNIQFTGNQFHSGNYTLSGFLVFRKGGRERPSRT